MWDISKHGILFPDATVRNDNTPCRVVGYHDNGLVVEETLTKKIVLTKSEYLEPIDLTNKLLVANSFERHNGANYWTSDDVNVCLRRVISDPHKIWWWIMATNIKNDFSIRGYIRYVHQLELIIGINGAKIKILAD